jgi:hypothetical protein
VKRVLLVPLAVLLELNALRIVLLVFLGRIVATLALGTSERYERSHEYSLKLA